MPWRSVQRTMRGIAGSSVVWGAIITVFGWGLVFGAPQAGFDPSWRTALYLAVHEHLHFGRQAMYTYGPYGFLDYPMLAYAGLARLAYAFTLLITVALATALVWALRRGYGSLWIAVPVALLALAVPMDPALSVVAIVAIGLLVTERPALPPGWVTGLAVAGGFVGALELLVKFSRGGGIVATVLVAIAALPERRRALAAFIGSFAACLLGLWLLAEQRIGDFAAFVHSSLSVDSGYSQAMGLEQAGRHWEYAAGAVVVALGLLAAIRGGLASAGRRVAAAAVWLVVCFVEFKEGFVRHDAHSTQFFATLLGVLLAFGWSGRRRLGGAIAVGIAVVVFFEATGIPPRTLLLPGPRARLFVADARLMLDGGRLDRAITSGRAALQVVYGVDHASLSLLAGHRVFVAPWEESAAWAYRLRWVPIPSWDGFTGYTSYLDGADAAALSVASAGPDRILTQPPRSLDGRVAAFDPPAEMRALLCHFVALRVTGAWAVLGRVGNRCGPVQRIGAVAARSGQSVRVPLAPVRSGLVFVRVTGAQVAGLESVRSALFRADFRSVVLDGNPYRLVPGTAADGLLLRAPAAADFPGPYAIAGDHATIAVTAPSNRLRFTFYAQPIRSTADLRR